jgi:uncharacterized membrane protein YqiK
MELPYSTAVWWFRNIKNTYNMNPNWVLNTLASIESSMEILLTIGMWLGGLAVVLILIGVRYIPHRHVGIIEKLWSASGSLAEGRILALNGEAGFQAHVLRGGLHFGYPFYMHSIHRSPLVTISEGRIGYVYARDGEPLEPTQTLGRHVDCNGFQNSVAFLQNGGQRGRQRAILREGVYAINTALFVVISETSVLTGPTSKLERTQCDTWQRELLQADGFSPVIVGALRMQQPALPGGANDSRVDPARLSSHDQIAVVTVHDGPALEPGEFIAPQVAGGKDGQASHHYFQDPEQFLELGGRRGKQLQVLTDGTYFINRWFATVEMQPKILIPIGYVGVVISYYGESGDDVTGSQFRYGQQVESGSRGVWREALAPGKYALNPYALKVELVPTVNFVLRWVSGQTESHRYDEHLSSIPLITADGYEPLLPLSLVLHIDYEKAPRVVQRFGDVKRLISQTLDPILTAYFRDIAQAAHMLELLTSREEIQRRATEELGRRFQDFDINCVAVLIGRPESTVLDGSEDPIDRLFDQLRQRRLAQEQKETFGKQQEAAARLKELNHAKAQAEKQTHLTETMVEIEIAGNKGSAQLAEAEQLAKREVALAEGKSRAQELIGRGEAAQIAAVGAAEAEVNRAKVEAFTDPRLYALQLLADRLADSKQPLVPERVVMLGGNGGPGGNNGEAGLFQSLLQVLTTWKTMDEDSKEPAEPKEFKVKL